MTVASVQESDAARGKSGTSLQSLGLLCSYLGQVMRVRRMRLSWEVRQVSVRNKSARASAMG
jgi:hypothetical protein